MSNKVTKKQVESAFDILEILSGCLLGETKQIIRIVESQIESQYRDVIKKEVYKKEKSEFVDFYFKHSIVK